MEINPLLSATYGNITRLIHFIFSMILTYSQSRLTLYFLDLLSQEPGARIPRDLQMKRQKYQQNTVDWTDCYYIPPPPLYYFIPPLTGVNINYITDITQISHSHHHQYNIQGRGERKVIRTSSL